MIPLSLTSSICEEKNLSLFRRSGDHNNTYNSFIPSRTHYSQEATASLLTSHNTLVLNSLFFVLEVGGRQNQQKLFRAT